MKAKMKNAEAEIRRVLDTINAAFRVRDAVAVMAHYASGAEIFDLAPPLVSEIGNDPKKLQAWIETWEGPIEREFRDLAIDAEGGLAVCHYLLCTKATSRQHRQPVKFWVRGTMSLRRKDAWKIVHEHESVPFYMDGSLKAAVDLTPESKAA
jgi:ketosteroid isomerase-like protein